MWCRRALDLQAAVPACSRVSWAVSPCRLSTHPHPPRSLPTRSLPLPLPLPLPSLYFGESNVEGMLNTLLPLHEMMRKQGPTTLKEIAFVQASAARLTLSVMGAAGIGGATRQGDQTCAT